MNFPKPSWRHHYIPKFYLKNFTNEQGQFYIYLVKKDYYKDNGKLFSLKSHFFEEDGNTLKAKNNFTDLLEKKHYQKIDDEAARIFDKINSSDKQLTAFEMCRIQYFISHLFWRNPQNNELINSQIKKSGINSLGIQIKDSVTEQILQNTNLEKDLIDNLSMSKIVKYWLPIITHQELLKSESQITVCNFIPDELPSLICDNPLILRNPEKLNIYSDDFILPISRKKVLISAKKIKKSWKNRTRFLIDLLLIMQSNNFIATSDKNYIPFIKSLGENMNLTEIKEEVFSSFIDN